MADITAACLLKHRRLITCRRGTLGATISTKLSQGLPQECEELKMKIVDGLMNVLCTYNADATLNCLTNAQVCDVIRLCYKILPEDC